MPAAPSSRIDPAIGQLLAAAQTLGSGRLRLLPVLAAIPAPRARRGVRHRLVVILSLAVCAVLAGARSFTLPGPWPAGLPPTALGSGPFPHRDWNRGHCRAAGVRCWATPPGRSPTITPNTCLRRMNDS